MTIFKITNLDTTGWQHAMRGMRNPMESHQQSDSRFVASVEKADNRDKYISTVVPLLGPRDLGLALKLIKAGPSHRKFLRHINIYCDITACLKWYDEFDTYLHVVKNSTSQMHMLGKDKITLDDFCFGDDPDVLDKSLVKILEQRLANYNYAREQLKSYLVDNPGVETPLAMEAEVKQSWRKLLDNIPQSFLYTRTCEFNYEVFMAMYPNRKNHKMIEWRLLCEELLRELPYMKDFMDIL